MIIKELIRNHYGIHPRPYEDLVENLGEYFLLLKTAEKIAKKKSWKVESAEIYGGPVFVVYKGKEFMVECTFRYSKGITLVGRRSQWEEIAPTVENLQYLMESI